MLPPISAAHLLAPRRPSWIVPFPFSASSVSAATSATATCTGYLGCCLEAGGGRDSLRTRLRRASRRWVGQLERDPVDVTQPQDVRHSLLPRFISLPSSQLTPLGNLSRAQTQQVCHIPLTPPPPDEKWRLCLPIVPALTIPSSESVPLPFSPATLLSGH